MKPSESRKGVRVWVGTTGYDAGIVWEGEVLEDFGRMGSGRLRVVTLPALRADASDLGGGRRGDGCRLAMARDCRPTRLQAKIRSAEAAEAGLAEETRKYEEALRRARLYRKRLRALGVAV